MRGDTVIRGGLYFDGRGNPAAPCDLRLRDGRVAAVAPTIEPGPDDTVVDATGHWVMPGFVDIHTHYDAEVELNPSLHESLRHGVTTVFMGSCSLSAAVGDPVDIADMFTRVEAIPYAYLKPLMVEGKTWRDHHEYAAHLDALPLGPNVASFVGYSAIRAAVLGLDRALEARVRPSADELARMEAMVAEGFDAGFLGLSLNTLYWDKMGGDRFRSHCLPSTYASWSELRRMVAVTRARDLNLQVIPNVSTKYELLFYAAFSMGLHGLRPALRTSLVSIMDLRSNRGIWRLLRFLGWAFNRVFGARFRYQCLPVAFDLWADGFENVVFEEFGAGAAGLHLETMIERRKLFADPAYRRRFRRQWNNPLLPKVFHRNFAHATVKECPDATLVGQTFAAIGAARGCSEVDAFLDLVVAYGPKLRWYTVTGNDRPGPLGHLIADDHNLIGFSDAGAHLRNMAFYNFPLRMLKFVRDAERRGTPVMPLERAVHRLTGELGDWFDLDVGSLEVGDRADVVILNPDRLDDAVEAIVEAEMPEFGGMKRLVRRNPGAIPAVFVAGERVVSAGSVHPDVGRRRGPGSFLRVRAPAEAHPRIETRKAIPQPASGGRGAECAPRASSRSPAPAPPPNCPPSPS
ncbi:MAG: N-acyl-D-glutamate amidohydrolase [Myxococcota bacterium]